MLSFGGAREHVSFFFLSYFFVGEKKTSQPCVVYVCF